MKNIKKNSAKSLVKNDFWEKEFISDDKTAIEKYWDDSIYANKKLQDLLKKYLPNGSKYNFLEVGCYPGSKLIFFKKNFNYSIYGVELIKDGCVKTRENLKRFNIKGEIVCADFFEESFLKKYKSKLDVIFDFGFCEHFKNFDVVVKNYSELLKKGGYLAIAIPNLRGAYKSIVSKSLLKKHNLNIMDLKKIQQESGKYFNKLFCGYVGGIYTDSAKGSNVNGIKNKRIKAFFLFLFICLNKIMNHIPVIESKTLSPYVVYIGQKKSTPFLNQKNLKQ